MIPWDQFVQWFLYALIMAVCALLWAGGKFFVSGVIGYFKSLLGLGQA